MAEQSEDRELNRHAKGGMARAQALTPDQRQEIAKKAAEARWQKDLPKATHSGELTIPGLVNVAIPCHNLEGGERILSTRGIMTSLKRRWRGRKYSGTQLPVFLEANNLKPFITKDMESVLTPVYFQPKQGGRAEGYRAEILPVICEVYLQARQSGKLKGQQLVVAQQCEILIRGFSRVGIIALVDEATGYQYDRARMALEEILEQFVAKELRKWVKTFPDEFYYQICKLRRWKLADINKRGPIWGKLTNNLIYRRLAPGVLKELKRLTPKDSKGRHKDRLFQRLTEHIGHPRLRELLASEITLMRVFDEGQWEAFMKAVNKSIPVYRDEPLFADLEDTETTETGMINEPLRLPA